MEKLNLKEGVEVSCFGKQYFIRSIIDLETILAAEKMSGELQTLKIKDLSDPSISKGSYRGHDKDLALIPDKYWAEAERRFEVIKPLLNNPNRIKEDVVAQATVSKVHPATIYRWIEAYRQTEKLSSLLPTKRSGGKGQSRISKEAEQITQDTIKEIYLSKQRHSIQYTCREVSHRCKRAGITPPHSNTIRNRILGLSEKERLKKRHGAKATEKKFLPTPDEFPGADWPLAFVQVDHTPLNLIIVDDEHRLPIGRPWLTVAIDVYSRMITGFAVALEPPGNLLAGLCISHSLLAKDHWLSRFEITTPWPVWGAPNNLHMDNAKEFRGEMISRACREYNINIHWRPVAKPRYGAHIERLLGSFNKDIHELPGTTFGSVGEREGYDSEKEAVFTLADIEVWITRHIVEIYHQKEHSSLNMSPIEKYKRGIFGEGKSPGTGLPEIILDEDTLKLNFLPFVMRTVQNYGITIDDIHYYADVFRPWINATIPRSKKKRQFLIRRDPRDISVVYFYDPELKEHFPIPYRNISHPPISLWELREVTKRIKEKGKRKIDEDLIFEAYEELRAIEEQAVATTKSVRRKQQRRKENQRTATASPRAVDIPVLTQVDLSDIKPFSDLKEIEHE